MRFCLFILNRGKIIKDLFKQRADSRTGFPVKPKPCRSAASSEDSTVVAALGPFGPGSESSDCTAAEHKSFGESCFG